MAEMQNPNTDGDSTVLCGANSYVEKYYLNEQFSGLPESIKQELQIMCVMYTEDIGGIILLEFMPDGRLQFKVEAEENDYLFDEIGSALKIKQYQAVQSCIGWPKDAASRCSCPSPCPRPRHR